MAVVPDELIKIFMFLTVFVVALNSFTNGFAQVHEEIEQMSSYTPMGEIDECQFSENSFNQGIFSYPYVEAITNRGLLWFLTERKTVQEVWVDSGSYIDLTVETDSRVMTDEKSLRLAEGEESGIYQVDFNLWPDDDRADYVGTYLNTISTYADIKEDHNVVVNVKVFEKNDSGDGDLPISYQNDYVIDDPNKSNFILDLDGYKVTEDDKWIRVSFVIDETTNISSESTINEFTIYGETVRTYDVRDYVRCSVLMVQSWGRSLFLDTGITALDGVFSVLGSIMFMISSIIAGLLILLGLAVAVMTTLI